MREKYRGKFKKLGCIIMILILTMTTVGCDLSNVSPEQNITNFQYRMQLNTNGIDKMFQYGFLTEEGRKLLKSSLETVGKQILKGLEGDESSLTALSKAVNCVETDIPNTLEPYLDPVGENHMLFDEYDAEQIQKQSNVKLMVLKSLAKDTHLEDIIMKINKYLESPKDEDSYKATLQDYFQDAVDEDGNPIEIELPPMIRETEVGKGLQNPNELGVDFVLKGYDTRYVNAQGNYYKTIPAATLQFYEVNPDFLQIIGALDDNDEPNYLLYRDGSEVKLILLNYPISHVKKIVAAEDVEPDENGDITYETELETSKYMYVNLKSGKLKKKISDNEYKTVDQKTGMIYTANDDDVANAIKYASANTVEDETINGSSFKAEGEVVTDISVKIKVGEEDNGGTVLGDDYKKVVCGQIILRDYIEAVYMPGITADEFVLTGRKIRLSKFSGKTKEDWGYYIDNAGRKYDETYMPAFLLQDLVGGGSGTGEYGGYFFKVRPNENCERGSVEGVTGSENEGDDEDNDGRIDNQVLAKSLPIMYCDSMYADIEVPCETLMTSDYGETIKTDERPIMYAFKTDKNAFDTKLYSGYINTTDTKNSLAWWNTWLVNNQFSYQVDVGDITKQFVGTYGYKDSGDGYIEFNSDTIKKLQNDLEVEESREYISIVRAIFIVIGIVLMFYGLALICAWIFDTNFILGPKLLTILSLGKWVAVVSKDEELDLGDGKRMMNFKDVVARAIIVTVIGTTVALFDVTLIIKILLDKITSIVKVLQERFMG